MSSNVDFPEPFGPTTPSRAPGSMSTSTSRSTVTSPKRLATPVELDDLVAEPVGADTEHEVGPPHTRRRGSPIDDLGRMPETGLGLRRPGGRTPSQPGQLATSQDPARRLGPGLAFEARRPRVQIRRVGTRSFGGHVHVPLPVVDLDHLARPATGREPIEHVPVVGDEHERRPCGRQPGLEPLDRFEVEVVGRLVEHDQVVLADERLGERHPLGLATRELVGPAGEQRLDAE